MKIALIPQSINEYGSKILSCKILFITLEFSRWQQGRSWSYQANYGFEEGFAANGISFITLPAICEYSPNDPASWLSHLKAICDGKQFEQVWIEVVHNNLDDTILSYIATLAPVRLAIIGESLRYPDEVYVHAPNLKNRQAKVVHRLKYMTHALVGDEQDAEWLNSRGIIKAIWWVGGIPEKDICTSVFPATNTSALFSGALYGEREKWLNHPLLKELLAQQQPLEEDAQLPDLFDQTNTQVIHTLRSTVSFSEDLLAQHVELLRKIRRQSFALWLKGLACGSAVVNLPSFYQGYAGRVYEGMAAGRPVISWQIPDRPKTNALFENGKDILLFPKDNPALLAEQIKRVVTDPVFAKQIVSNAFTKLQRFHTVETRIRQIMEWIESGKEPAYHDEETVKSGDEEANSFYVDLWNDPAWSSPHPNADEEARWAKISKLINSYCFENGNKRKESFRVLDVGCGRGWLSMYLEKYGEYVGIEPVPGAVEIANTLFPGRKFLTGYTGDLLKSSVPKFDIIVSTEVIEHVPYNEQNAFVSELYALLNDDGFLVLTTPRREVYDYILRRGLKPQPVEDWLTEDQLEKLVRSKGFFKFGMERIFYDASTGRFYLNPTDNEIGSYGLIALYQLWAFKKKTLSSNQISVDIKTGRPPLVSVIVPTHNRPEMLKGTIQSILDQTFQDFEIVVVNDGGQDVSSVVQAFNSSMISYLSHDTNKGLAAARNTGIHAAKGKYIAYLDDDDLFYPSHLGALVRLLESGEYEVAYTDAYRAHQEKKNGEYVVTKRDVPFSSDFDYDRILAQNFIPVLCVMHARSCVEQAGLFDESLKNHEDWDMWIRMSRKFKFAHIKELTCEFVWRTDGTTMTSGNIRGHEEGFQMIKARYAAAKPSSVHIPKFSQKPDFILNEDGAVTSTDAGKIRPYYTPGLPQATDINGIQLLSRYAVKTADRPNTGDKDMLAVEQVYEAMQPVLQASRPEDAVQALQNIVRSFPNFARAHSDLGMLYYQSGEKQKAIVHYERAATISPEIADFQKNLADYYYVEMARAEDALKLYSKVLQARPKDVETLMTAGHILVSLKRFDEADAYYRKVLEIEPWNKAANEIHNKLSQKSRGGNGSKKAEDMYAEVKHLLDLGDQAGARRALEKMLGVYPHFALAHNDLAVLCYQSGDKDQALRHYEEALRLQPDNSTFQKNLGDFYYIEQGRIEDALRIYVRILETQPKDIETLMATGHICSSLSRWDDARIFYRRVLEIEPWKMEARKQLGMLENRTIGAASLKFAPSAQDMYAEASRLVSAGSVEAGKDRLTELVKSHPDFAIAYNDLGVLAYRAGENQSALLSYQTAVRLEPSNLTFKKNLADIYWKELGRIEDALKIYVEIMVAHPEDVETLLATGKICLSLRQPNDARVFFDRVLKIEPWNAEAQTHSNNGIRQSNG